jgi:pimeloyl-ACP methyl ester carboxylesterase
VADEFALLAENAAEAGLASSDPAVRRVSHGAISAIAWGDGPADVVLVHGGGQNAHTWDTVVLYLLDRFPALHLLAVDLPGHGHSAWRDDRDYAPQTSAATLEPVLDALAPHPKLVVGMSLGGMVTIRLAATRPDLVPRAVIVDVTPSAGQRHQAMTTAQRGTVALIAGPPAYDTFEEMVDATAAAAPSRSRSSVRRGVLHNSRQDEDGRWVWRYDRRPRDAGAPGGTPLWDDLATSTAPMTLVRGGASAFVSDEDATEFVRRHPNTTVHVVHGSGHSVQSDAPATLADIIAGVLG